MYKDLVKFLQTNDHLTDNQLKKKGEFNFQNDELLEGGQKGVMSNDISYTEVNIKLHVKLNKKKEELNFAN